MKFIEIAYIVSTMISLLAGIPQARQLMIEKRSDEFSLSSWSLWVGTQCVSLMYALSIHNMLLAAVNVMWVSFYAFMVALILRYRTRSVVITAPADAIAGDPVLPSNIIK